MKRFLFMAAAACAICGLAAVSRANAQDGGAQAAPASSPAPPAAPQSQAVPVPAFAGPLSANANPPTVDAGPLGKIAIDGAVSGLALFQDNPFPGDRRNVGDVSNAQVWITKTDGPIQFYVQAGAYSLPALGAPYVKSGTMTSSTYGAIPQAFVKIVPNSVFSIQVGKLPTLIGAESTFTFENMNIARGLLWNQESAVSRGVQANYSNGPLTVSLALTDGFYSDRYNWLSGLVSYAFTSADTLSVVAGGNLGHTAKSTFATPLFQNNSQIVNVIYTHTKGPWTITPYFQWTHVPASPATGIAQPASTWGGAVLGKYAFTPAFSLAGRVEYIKSRVGPCAFQQGEGGCAATNLLYGPRSDAWSFTLTPTYQKGVFFIRGEYAYVKVGRATPGLALGPNLNATSQNRVLVEGGFLF